MALEAKLWLIKQLGFEIPVKAMRRPGLDYWKHLEWEVNEDWKDFLAKRQPESMWLFSRFATHSYSEVEYSPGDTLAFGCETAGLPKSITESHAESLLRIPTHANVRSINLSCAVAVAGFEATRQIGSPF